MVQSTDEAKAAPSQSPLLAVQSTDLCAKHDTLATWTRKHTNSKMESFLLQFAFKEIARTLMVALEDAKTLTHNIILLIWQVECATGVTTNHQWHALVCMDARRRGEVDQEMGEPRARDERLSLTKAALDSFVALRRSAFGARTIFLTVSRAVVKLA